MAEPPTESSEVETIPACALPAAIVKVAFAGTKSIALNVAEGVFSFNCAVMTQALGEEPRINVVGANS